jgi:hypothetical protein
MSVRDGADPGAMPNTERNSETSRAPGASKATSLTGAAVQGSAAARAAAISSDEAT